MTIKECIDTVDNIKPNQYETKEKVLWLSFIDEIIINDVLKTHEGYDGRYDDFAGYSEDKLSIPLIVPSPYDRLYTAYLKMKIDGENGETARYNNSAAMFNTYMMEFRKYYNKTHMPLTNGQKPMPPRRVSASISDAELENLKRELYHILYNDVCEMASSDKINDVVRSYMSTNAEMFKGKDGKDGAKGDKGDKGEKGDEGETPDLTGYISMWQPNTEYKVDDVVIVNFEDKDLFDPNDEFLYRTIIAKCVRPHKSESFFLLNNNELEEAWVILQETYAYYDALGRRIHNTYATKEELAEAIGLALEGDY